MPGYKETSRNPRPLSANDNVRVEPNTGEWDKNPVPFSKGKDDGGLWYESQGLNVIAIALAIVLAAAVVYLAR